MCTILTLEPFLLFYPSFSISAARHICLLLHFSSMQFYGRNAEARLSPCFSFPLADAVQMVHIGLLEKACCLFGLMPFQMLSKLHRRPLSQHPLHLQDLRPAPQQRPSLQHHQVFNSPAFASQFFFRIEPFGTHYL